MAKPWARYELDYINHPKFLVLSHGAICLWLEGKNYCDKYHTDGLIRREALRTFRFCNRARVEELQQVIDGYAGPLWEAHVIGFKMHDYLNHNDCRDKVLTRIDGADEKKRKGTERLARWREKQEQMKRDLKRVTTSVTSSVTSSVTETPVVTPVVTPFTETETETETKEQKKSSGGSKRPVYTSDRLTVFEWQLDELSKVLGPHVDAFDLHGFFDGLTQYSRQRGLVIPREDAWKWLQGQVVAEAKRRGLPMAGAQTTAGVNGCFHTPSCRDASQHTRLMLAESA